MQTTFRTYFIFIRGISIRLVNPIVESNLWISAVSFTPISYRLREKYGISLQQNKNTPIDDADID